MDIKNILILSQYFPRLFNIFGYSLSLKTNLSQDTHSFIRGSAWVHNKPFNDTLKAKKSK